MSESHALSPEPVRALRQSVAAAVAAAGAADPAGFDAALAEVGRGGARRPDPSQVSVVLGLLLGDLLERTHPDGIDSDDAEQVVERCLRRYRTWYPQLDEDQLIRALAGALRVDTDAGPDAAAMGDRTALTAHGLLLVADLLDVSHEQVLPRIDAVLSELQREQVNDIP